MRKQTTIIRCDGDGCDHYAEVVDHNETPDGWYRIAVAAGGKLDLKHAFDLCGLICVGKWAKARRAFLNETGNGAGTRTRQLILEVMADGEAVSIPDIATLIERTSTSVQQNIRQLVQDEQIVVVREPVMGNSKEPGLYRLAKSPVQT